MITRHQNLWLVAFIFFLFSITACKKDISVSSPELEKLTGTWEWVQSSGGIYGRQSTPALVGYTQAIEYNKNGIYKKFKNESQVSQMIFTIKEGSSIYSSGKVTLIDYTSSVVYHSNDNPTTQSFSFGGQDTLFLNDECYDCSIHIYTRKK